jgi:SHS2 domain-containing protein
MRSMHSFADHTGELELRLHAHSLAALFEEAGRALAEVMGAQSPTGSGAHEEILLRARDREALLVAWLNELIFLAERDKTIFGDIRIEHVHEGELRARVRGVPTEGLKTQVKAATFHALRVSDDANGVSATVILDI